MRFSVILHDLDKKRRKVLSSSDYSNPIGVVEAENQAEAAAKIGLLDGDNGRYEHHLSADIEVQLQMTSLGVTVFTEEDLVARINEVLDYVNELYGMYS